MYHALPDPGYTGARPFQCTIASVRGSKTMKRMGWLVRSCAPLAPLLNAPLSGREKAVLYLLVHGKAARDIATTLCISSATVCNHLQTILCQLDVHSQREAVRLAL
jgi:DNA-binding NarL/FixJ family response regulator